MSTTPQRRAGCAENISIQAGFDATFCSFWHDERDADQLLAVSKEQMLGPKEFHANIFSLQFERKTA
ncbi:MAG: hypothetical protein ACI9IV_002085 [Paracoccaceae bacterium]